MIQPRIDIDMTGRRIRILMDLAGLSVKDVCEELGLSSVQSIYHWLHGRNLPAIDNLYALGMLLKVPVDAIICGNGGDGMNDPECEKKAQELPEVPFQSFLEGLDNGTLFEKYGDPVRIAGAKSEAVAMSPESYEQTATRIEHLEQEIGDPTIKYYIYEFEAEEQVWEALNRVAAEREMTLNELFISAFEAGLSEKPVVLGKASENDPQEPLHLTLIRHYPVRKDETELQAKRRKIEEEKKNSDNS